MEPLIFVIFGASGDLTRRKLIPAIYALFENGHLPDNFAVLGVSRSKLSDEEFRKSVFWESEFMDLPDQQDERIQNFGGRLYYESVEDLSNSSYGPLRARLEGLNQKHDCPGNYIFYLSTPPSLYDKIPAALAREGLHKDEKSWRRLVIEKPFGYDRASAAALNTSLRENFEEDQIYRIDHYLGKETVQNLLVTRFANGIFEPLWNRNYIHHVEVTSAENIGVGSRGGYYDKSGALRDMLQNHLLQVMAHVAMEPPISSDASAIRSEKIKLFQALRPIKAEEVGKYVVRGQYLASMIRGEQVKGYRDEEGVPKNSLTETYAAVKFYIDNWRWSGVPFYIRTGKRLPTKVTEVVINFKKPPHTLFQRNHEMFGDTAYNQLVIRIQPDEGLLMKFGMKIPGQGFHVKNVGMDFHYSDLTNVHVPAAYERLLLDCMKGDATLYAHGDSVEYAWAFVEPILDAWENDPAVKMFGYPAGTWGPLEADGLIKPKQLGWRQPCKNLTADESYCEL
ncbi:MAG: glucose-6-phosphate dehydrogenase [Bacteroidota bacterium]